MPLMHSISTIRLMYLKLQNKKGFNQQLSLTWSTHAEPIHAPSKTSANRLHKKSIGSLSSSFPSLAWNQLINIPPPNKILQTLNISRKTPIVLFTVLQVAPPQDQLFRNLFNTFTGPNAIILIADKSTEQNLIYFFKKYQK